MDVLAILPGDFQLSVEILPAVLHVVQEEVLCILAGVGHILCCAVPLEERGTKNSRNIMKGLAQFSRGTEGHEKKQ